MELTPLGGVQYSRGEIPDQGVKDFEIQQAFRGTYDGPMQPDPDEVAEVKAVSLEYLDDWMQKRPEDFTPWLLRDLKTYQIL